MNAKDCRMKVALIIDEHLKPRVIKIASALSRRGIAVYLLGRRDVNYRLGSNRKVFQKVILFNPEKREIHQICKAVNADVYHIFAETNISKWIEQFIIENSKKKKIIFDQYDSYRGFVTDDFDEFARREKNCLENANGVCERNFEVQYIKERFGYKLPAELQFFDYCYGYENEADRLDNGEKLKIVYGGRLIGRSIFADKFSLSRYKIERDGLYYLSQIINKHNGLFYIIPFQKTMGPFYSEYRNLTKKYSSTFLGNPMDIEELIGFEKQMDYGIDCFDVEELVKKYSDGTTGIEHKNKYYATNKFFDYLDAGIMPIYSRDYELFGKYLENRGAAIYCKVEDFDDRYDELMATRYKNKELACKARKELSINNQIVRLINFYDEIIKE